MEGKDYSGQLTAIWIFHLCLCLAIFIAGAKLHDDVCGQISRIVQYINVPTAKENKYLKDEIYHLRNALDECTLIIHKQNDQLWEKNGEKS